MSEPKNYLKVGNYRVGRADDHNLVVEEFRLVKAKPGRYVKEARETEKWVFRGYYPDLPSAAKGILGYLDRDAIDESTDLKSLMSQIEDNKSTVITAVKNADLKTEDFVK